MNLQDIINRNQDLQPWEEGERVPWDDPVISAQVLKEHLSQDSSAASRQISEIHKHCVWIDQEILQSKRADILDLGCGPGLYAQELQKAGHMYTGIDIAPAAITFAKKLSIPGCEFLLGDFRDVPFGKDRNLILFLFGAINLIPKSDAQRVIEKIFMALKPGGKILIEATSVEAADQIGNQPAMWYSAEEGIFSPQPHLCLMESYWDENFNTATERYFILDPQTNQVKRFCASTVGYDIEELEGMLEKAGFSNLRNYATLSGEEEDFSIEFSIVSGTKPI